ncbi:MAG: hypothetical protein ACOCSJ_04705, partial [Candidatus Natronoplasma sp.]
ARLLEESSGESDIPVNFQEELLSILKSDQKDGETYNDYENRIWNASWELIKRREEYEYEEDEEGSEEREKERKSEEEVEKSKDGQISLTDFGGD